MAHEEGLPKRSPAQDRNALSRRGGRAVQRTTGITDREGMTQSAGSAASEQSDRFSVMAMRREGEVQGDLLMTWDEMPRRRGTHLVGGNHRRDADRLRSRLRALWSGIRRPSPRHVDLALKGVGQSVSSRTVRDARGLPIATAPWLVAERRAYGLCNEEYLTLKIPAANLSELCKTPKNYSKNPQ